MKSALVLKPEKMHSFFFNITIKYFNTFIVVAPD